MDTDGLSRGEKWRGRCLKGERMGVLGELSLIWFDCRMGFLLGSGKGQACFSASRVSLSEMEGWDEVAAGRVQSSGHF